MKLKYGVTPLFSPDIDKLSEQLPRHSVWVHNGHGQHVSGITVIKKVSDGYRTVEIKADDITHVDLDYDLVVMNTCESTDRLYRPIRFGSNGRIMNGHPGA